MATSVLAGLYASAGVQIDKLSILGNTWSITRPQVVSFGVAAAFVYFLARYYQHLRDLNDPGPREAFAARVGAIAEQRAIKGFRQSFPKQFQPNQDLTDIRFSLKTRGHGDPYDHWTFVFEGTMGFRGPDGVLASISFGDRSVAEPIQRLDRIRARVWVALNTRFFTEYYLPLVFALLPLAGLLYAAFMRGEA